MKNQIELQDATPGKALFRSIIADYDTETSICELIDNSIDVWTIKKRNQKLNVTISIDIQRQTIKIRDNAGGLKKEDLHLIVGPGHSSNDSSSKIIGTFGVGSKRSVIALSPQIIVKTRYKKLPTHSIDISDDWLKDDDWMFPVYQVNDIDENTTEIEMLKLRREINSDSLRFIKKHLSSVYAKILENKLFNLMLNGEDIKPTHFDRIWSFNETIPPEGFEIKTIIDSREVKIKISSGLIAEGGDTGFGDYGVYIYCNDRLIVQKLKNFDVGFGKGQAGEPHNSKSLARIIIEIEGPAELMPWNSSKNAINTQHKVFNLIRPKLVELVKRYTDASRNLFPERTQKIFPYTNGSIKFEKIDSVSEIDTTLLPEIPKLKKGPLPKTRNLNQALANSNPWIIGTYETVVIAESLQTKAYETKNRIILILLDSSIEIAFKDYLTNKVKKPFYQDSELAKIFEKRHTVHNEVKKHCGNLLDIDDWSKLDYYYRLRCDLVHKRATANVIDSDIKKFTNLTKKVHKKLLGVKYPS
ncbi:ATP-binding protein [Leptospira levettii]|uniref:ATP-binding protein n=1 Tax=Leptospira levettii TaxID=2023178 RepID=UPI00108325A7|nr:ATP-binding protein [Leptospira levettii]TGM73567.1 ATP-binding protein [Leptospira levettii]